MNVPIAGQCCGKCIKKVCTHKNAKGEEVTSEIGENWYSPSECEMCTCEKAADGSAKTSCKPSGKQPWSPNGDLCTLCKCVVGADGSKKECEKTTCTICKCVVGADGSKKECEKT